MRVRIPRYRYPRNAWRYDLHAAVIASQAAAGVRYSEDERLEVTVRLYLSERSLRSHDVDNRIKDVLDALQGRAGGSKGVRKLEAIIPNDRQIYKVSVEKSVSPKQGGGLGHLVIRKYRPAAV